MNWLKKGELRAHVNDAQQLSNKHGGGRKQRFYPLQSGRTKDRGGILPAAGEVTTAVQRTEVSYISCYLSVSLECL